MNIVVAQISEDEGLTLHHVYPTGEPDLMADDVHLVGQTEVDLQASRAEEEVALLGSVRAVVGFECDRCLATLSVAVEQSFDLVYVPPLGIGDEHELEEDDLSLGFYHDGMIDIDDLAREQIELALPMARLCADECKGLCPECGANLNTGACGCDPTPVDARWASLMELKSKLN